MILFFTIRVGCLDLCRQSGLAFFLQSGAELAGESLKPREMHIILSISCLGRGAATSCWSFLSSAKDRKSNGAMLIFLPYSVKG